MEVRVPPYAAVQVVEGVRHTRGTPPAVVETDAATWIAVATGEPGLARRGGGGAGERQRGTDRPDAVPAPGPVGSGCGRCGRAPRPRRVRVLGRPQRARRRQPP
ncbi:sterol carrier family protein [Nocardioides convexus]|uniref:sterol carrier family protein n=1 Tax=Nocardioides convexus TaxID=2712224 RepID=UPI00241899C4|nr:sterol carrier family protein [Nocardioides convexus]